MNYQNIELTEGQRMKFVLTISNETDLSNYDIEGYTKGFSSCNCSVKEFEVIEVKNNIVILLTPSLTAGSHGYQLYVTNINTNQQFKVAEGRIEVTPNYSHETHLSEKYATIEAILHSDTIEMTMTIDKGMQGDKGEKGDTGLTGAKGEKGDTGLSAYEIALKHGYNGSEQKWVEEFQGAADAATEAKNAATEAKSEKDFSKQWAESSKNYFNQTEQVKNETENLMNETSGYSQSALNSLNQTVEFKTAAETAAETAQSLVTTANNTIKNAAIKTANNTFTGTNTFNGTVAANGGIIGLPYVLNNAAAVNLETEKFLSFVNSVNILEKYYPITIQTNNGKLTTVKNNTFSVIEVPNNEILVARQSIGFDNYDLTGNYMTYRCIWIPFSCIINRISGKMRMVVNISTASRSAGSKIERQTTDLNKPFTNYSDIISANSHFGNFELFADRVVEDGKTYIYWTVYAPQIASDGTISEIKTYNIKLGSTGYNYAGCNGFLIVPISGSQCKLFMRYFNGGSPIWLYMGTLEMKNSTWRNTNTVYKILYAGMGVDAAGFTLYCPHNITFAFNSTNFPSCQEMLNATVANTMTEGVITLEEWEAMFSE